MILWHPRHEVRWHDPPLTACFVDRGSWCFPDKWTLSPVKGHGNTVTWQLCWTVKWLKNGETKERKCMQSISCSQSIQESKSRRVSVPFLLRKFVIAFCKSLQSKEETTLSAKINVLLSVQLFSRGISFDHKLSIFILSISSSLFTSITDYCISLTVLSWHWYS